MSAPARECLSLAEAVAIIGQGVTESQLAEVAGNGLLPGSVLDANGWRFSVAEIKRIARDGLPEDRGWDEGRLRRWKIR